MQITKSWKSDSIAKITLIDSTLEARLRRLLVWKLRNLILAAFFPNVTPDQKKYEKTINNLISNRWKYDFVIFIQKFVFLLLRWKKWKFSWSTLGKELKRQMSEIIFLLNFHRLVTLGEISNTNLRTIKKQLWFQHTSLGMHCGHVLVRRRFESQYRQQLFPRNLRNSPN